ncbi:hypothetical protein B0H13DRAFT_2329699 [Mycena leptocephala]|nr:hypothetical protein B0H13DRAFT_2329699 [Mycena leptocephala]
MAPRFTSVITKHVVRPLLPAPCPVTLPIPTARLLLLPIFLIVHLHLLPVATLHLLHVATLHLLPVATPHLLPVATLHLLPVAPIHLPLHLAMSRPAVERFADANGRLRLRPRLRLFTCDSHKDPKALIRKHPSRQVVVPRSLSPLDPAGAGAEIYGLQVRLDELCTQYLRPSVVLSYQDKDELSKVYNKMTAKFPWLAHYDNYWPVSVCLQGKLHNSAARATEKSTRKVLNIIAGTAPSFLRELRCRHYSTSHNTPRFAFTPTHIEYCKPDASRYPLVESIFSDAAHQPWIHDFNVRLQHGQKISRFRIFMKRGKALNANACANTIAGDVVIMRVAAHDTTSVVNMRSTDSRIADYVFHAALQRMTKFQSVHRTRLPKELTVYRAHAFPGSP